MTNRQEFLEHIYFHLFITENIKATTNFNHPVITFTCFYANTYVYIHHICSLGRREETAATLAP